jgi:hypothetical protein
VFIFYKGFPTAFEIMVKAECKVVQRHEDILGTGGMALRILNVGTRWR